MRRSDFRTISHYQPFRLGTHGREEDEVQLEDKWRENTEQLNLGGHGRDDRTCRPLQGKVSYINRHDSKGGV